MRRNAWVWVVALVLSGLAGAESPAVAQADSLWDCRDDPSVASKMEPQLREALKENAHDYDLLWRAARERAWVADNAPDGRLKKQAGREAWNYAEQAISVDAARAEGYYYAGAGIGAYAAGAGIIAAIGEGLEGKFLGRMQRAAELAPKLDRGGPLLALGRYYYTIPWPKQDLKKAESLYETVLRDFPENLRAQHYLAQLKAKANHKDEAREAEARVRGASVEYDPAEGRRVKVWAARTEEQLKK